MWLTDWMIDKMRLNQYFGDDDDGLDDDDPEYEGDDSYEEDRRQSRHTERKRAIRVRGQTRKGSHPAEREISMLQPKEFGECQDAAGALLESKVVIIDLSAATQGPAQRIIDFVSGTVYAIDGDFKKISDNIFIAAPAGVDLTGEFNELAAKAQSGLFQAGTGLFRMRTA